MIKAKIKRPPAYVWTLRQWSKHGEDFTVYATKRAAFADLVEFVDAWWEEVAPPDDDVELSPEERVELYFDQKQDVEGYSITETQVYGEPATVQTTAQEKLVPFEVGEKLISAMAMIRDLHKGYSWSELGFGSMQELQDWWAETMVMLKQHYANIDEEYLDVQFV